MDKKLCGARGAYTAHVLKFSQKFSRFEESHSDRMWSAERRTPTFAVGTFF
jgi:hypothetical protein